MRWLADVRFRLRALFARRGLDRQLDEEFAFHLEMEARKLRSQGWSPVEAAREAERRLGSTTRAREAARDRWGVSLAWQLAADVRHAFRQYRRRPGFTAIAVLTLGLGIGATVAIGSAAHSLLVAPLPVDDESRIDVLWMPQVTGPLLTGRPLRLICGWRSDGEVGTGAKGPSCPLSPQTASEMLAKLKSRTRNAGSTCPVRVRSARPISSILLTMISGLSFQRKFFTARVIFPFSIRNVPSRVRPVSRPLRGSRVFT